MRDASVCASTKTVRMLTHGGSVLMRNRLPRNTTLSYLQSYGIVRV